MKKIFYLVCFLQVFYCFSLKAELILIANRSNPEEDLSFQEIQQIFMGKKRVWSNGLEVFPAVLSGGEVHREFLRAYLDISSKRYSTYWRRITFTGKGRVPRAFSSQYQLVDYVRYTPGAIGYIDSETPHDGLQLVETR